MSIDPNESAAIYLALLMVICGISYRAVRRRNAQYSQAGEPRPGCCPSCGENTGDGSRCDQCQTIRDIAGYRRPKHHTTLRGVPLRQRRQARTVLGRAIVCGICGHPPTDDNPLTAGHATRRDEAAGALRAMHRTSCRKEA